MKQDKIIAALNFVKEEGRPAWTGSLDPQDAEIPGQLAEKLRGSKTIRHITKGRAELLPPEADPPEPVPEISPDELHIELEKLLSGSRVVHLTLCGDCFWDGEKRTLSITTPMAKAMGISASWYRNRKPVKCLLIMTGQERLFLARNAEADLIED